MGLDHRDVQLPGVGLGLVGVLGTCNPMEGVCYAIT